MNHVTTQDIGPLLMVGFEGTALSPQTARFIRRHHIGGVILFSRNIESAKQCRALTHEIARLVPEMPLLVGIDQEGGRVSRLAPPFPQFPSARHLGNLNVVDQTYRTAADMAVLLSSLGIHINFAPVLDVDTNSTNPVIGDRAFGNTPEQVIRHATAFIAGLQDHGIAACGKHFPGHGDTATDSHHVLPSVVHAPERLHQIEIPPFTAAIAHGVACLMTAHVLYPAWDPVWPASLSEKIVTDLLRRDMKYEGVVVSDDLQMRGITQGFSVAQAAVRAVETGSDMLLICHGEDQQQEAVTALAHAAESGMLSEARLLEARMRLQHLRERCTFQGL